MAARPVAALGRGAAGRGRRGRPRGRRPASAGRTSTRSPRASAAGRSATPPTRCACSPGGSATAASRCPGRRRRGRATTRRRARVRLGGARLPELRARRRARRPVVLGRFTVAFSSRAGADRRGVRRRVLAGGAPTAASTTPPCACHDGGGTGLGRAVGSTWIAAGGMSEVTARRTTGDDPDARLVAAMTAEIGGSTAGRRPGSSATPGELSPPDGGFVVLERGRPRARGRRPEAARRPGSARSSACSSSPRRAARGLGARLLEALEALARDLGYAVARLDTGAKQPGAQRLYERAGYRADPGLQRRRVRRLVGREAAQPAVKRSVQRCAPRYRAEPPDPSGYGMLQTLRSRCGSTRERERAAGAGEPAAFQPPTAGGERAQRALAAVQPRAGDVGVAAARTRARAATPAGRRAPSVQRRRAVAAGAAARARAADRPGARARAARPSACPRAGQRVPDVARRAPASSRSRLPRPSLPRSASAVAPPPPPSFQRHGRASSAAAQRHEAARAARPRPRARRPRAAARRPPRRR